MEVATLPHGGWLGRRGHVEVVAMTARVGRCGRLDHVAYWRSRHSWSRGVEVGMRVCCRPGSRDPHQREWKLMKKIVEMNHKRELNINIKAGYRIISSSWKNDMWRLQ